MRVHLIFKYIFSIFTEQTPPTSTARSLTAPNRDCCKFAKQSVPKRDPVFLSQMIPNANLLQRLGGEGPEHNELAGKRTNVRVNPEWKGRLGMMISDRAAIYPPSSVRLPANCRNNVWAWTRSLSSNKSKRSHSSKL